MARVLRRIEYMRWRAGIAWWRYAMGTGSSRECPICGWRGYRFAPAGNKLKRRRDALCPRCLSLERQRAAYLLLDRPAAGRRVLHVGPEPCIGEWLRAQSAEYLSIDLAPGAMQQMDITDLKLDDGSYDVIWCSHVLEHVPHDRAAMAEMRRVLNPGGSAYIQVPVYGPESEEDPSVQTPQERLRRFYQVDHVRNYGLDIVDRLAAAGFDVSVRDSSEIGEPGASRHAVHFPSTEHLFVCTVPAPR